LDLREGERNRIRIEIPDELREFIATEWVARADPEASTQR